MNQPDATDPGAPKVRGGRRMSWTAKLLIVFGVVTTMTILGCCVFAVLLFHPDLTTRQAEVEAIAQKFGPLKIPEGFRGDVAVTTDNSLLWMRIVRYKHNEGRGQLVLGGAHWKFVNDEESNSKLYELFLNEVAPTIRLLDIREKRGQSVEIGGKNEKFEIALGEDRASTTRFRQVTGSFPSSSGRINLLLQVEEGFLSDEAIDELLNSLAAKESAPSNLNSK